MKHKIELICIQWTETIRDLEIRTCYDNESYNIIFAIKQSVVHVHRSFQPRITIINCYNITDNPNLLDTITIAAYLAKETYNNLSNLSHPKYWKSLYNPNHYPVDHSYPRICFQDNKVLLSTYDGSQWSDWSEQYFD